MNQSEISTIFDSELTAIADDSIRELAISILLCAPARFWAGPASGGHHYRDERDPGGAILHAKRTARVVAHLCRAWYTSSLVRDHLIAAALVHDIGYDPDAKDKPQEYRDHPKRVRELSADSFVHVSREDWSAICSIVEQHMGRWGDTGLPVSEPHLLLHMADVIASRKDILVQSDSEIATLND